MLIKDTTKRYIISITETFFVSFLWIFLLWIESALDKWSFDETILLSIISASIIAWLKWVIKVLRESLNWYDNTKK